VTPVTIAPAQRADIGGVIKLLTARAPSHWISKVSDADLRSFVEYVLGSRRSILLVAHPTGEVGPAGYVFAVLDARWFWILFALRHPLIAQKISFIRVRRIFERRQNEEPRAPAVVGAMDSLPQFAWSPSHPRVARILGLYVHEDHRRKDIPMNLYFNLFAALEERGAVHVEEYLAVNHAQYMGKFPEDCGWRLQKCRCEGHKITKPLAK
jgi:ribosomal protein S18 acetylase RimI-like enzyme